MIEEIKHSPSYKCHVGLISSKTRTPNSKLGVGLVANASYRLQHLSKYCSGTDAFIDLISFCAPVTVSFSISFYHVQSQWLLFEKKRLHSLTLIAIFFVLVQFILLLLLYIF